MKLVTYPLDGVTYSAEDVAAYLCTRTSGVYSRDSNFAVTVSGPREITVSPGLAWINYDDFKGISVCARERGTLTVPDADDMLPRIDRVVLQFDANANLTALKLKPGTPEAEPTAPELIRTHFIYELCLCEISVPAGSAEITAASLTDTRTDEALCGLMRDGVTGLPMEALGAQALAKAKETAKLCDKLLASYTGGYLGIWPVTLTADGWAECTVAVAAGLAGVCETKDGSITFWAENVPEGGIQMQVELLGPSASTADTGADTLGDTVLEDTTL